MATQYFLPVATRDNRLLAVIPISPTAFDGTETSFTLSGTPRPLNKIPIQDYNSRSYPPTKFVMAIAITRVQESANAWMGFAASVLPIQSVWPFREWANTQGSTPNQQESLGTVFTFLTGGGASAVSGPTASTQPTLTSPLELTWTCVTPIANAPACAFFDFNWVQLFAVNANSNVGDPAYITVTGQPAGGLLKALVLQMPEPMGPEGGPVYNTIRIMKMTPQPLVAGDYEFTFTVYNTSGLASATATLDLTVVT
jgi:hypothetical protein